MIDREVFLNTLKQGTEDKELQLDVCQYFVSNYPVLVDETAPFTDPFGRVLAVMPTGRKIWSSLPDYDVRKDTMFNLEANFKKLQVRINELETYGKESN
jgi:hypothetical protein